MPLKTPAEYVESLRDGRVVFWDGDKIEDVTKDARFRGYKLDANGNPITSAPNFA